MHNARTYYGTVAGVLKLTGDCCVAQLDVVVASGVYTVKHYPFIRSSETPATAQPR